VIDTWRYFHVSSFHETPPVHGTATRRHVGIAKQALYSDIMLFIFHRLPARIPLPTNSSSSSSSSCSSQSITVLYFVGGISLICASLEEFFVLRSLVVVAKSCERDSCLRNFI
jgi:hypothetical protein